MNDNEAHPAALTPEQVQSLVDKQLALNPLQGRQTNTLSGIDLEYWAALALGLYRPVIIPTHIPHVVYIGPSQNPDDRKTFNPLGNPPLMAEIIAEQQIKLHPVTDFWVVTSDISGRVIGTYGMNRAEAALRCVIASHLGPEVNASPSYLSKNDKNENYLNENDRAAMERLSIARWLKNRSRMTPEELAEEAEWFANGVEPVAGWPGCWTINRPKPPEWWAEIDRQAEELLAEFERTHPDLARRKGAQPPGAQGTENPDAEKENKQVSDYRRSRDD